MASWAHQFSGLTEVRDVKEVLTLAEIGLAPESVFPLPPLSVDGRWAAVDSARTLKSQITFHGGNLILDVLNWMHGGGEIQDVLSQAQMA